MTRTAWGFNVRGNNVFFKPQAKQPNTNLTIVSDLGRTYSFELFTNKQPFYVVKMRYPTPKKANPPPLKAPCTDGKYNFRYVKWGDEELAPLTRGTMYRFTCMKFSKNAELPVIYQINADGKESLVNYHIEQDTIVIHSVANEYRLRLGERVLGVLSHFVEFAVCTTKKRARLKRLASLRRTNMSDDNTIPSAYESANLDRGELTVSGRKRKTKRSL